MIGGKAVRLTRNSEYEAGDGIRVKKTRLDKR